MPVMLSVVNEEEKGLSAPDDYLFEEDRVTIGRGEENDLTLSDPKRVVSSEHAMLERSGDSYQLIDRGSKNFTYVGNERLSPGEPYTLSEGDVFRIGDFRIEYTQPDYNPKVPSSADGGDGTVFESEFENPFEEPIDQLVEALAALTDSYDEVAPQRRDDALAEAVEAADPPPGVREAVRQTFGDLGLAPSDEIGASTGSESTGTATGNQTEVESTSTAAGNQTDPEQTDSESTGTATGSSGAGGTASAGRSASSSAPAEGGGQQKVAAKTPVLDTMADALAEVLPIPWRFRHEFIGQTMMQAPETEFLYEGDGETIKQHLTDPSISEEEREERLGYVEEAAESLAVHQVAMLNGYKASVMNGAEELLEQFDPEEHREAVLEENVVFEYLPMLASPAVLERIRAELGDLYGDWSAAEQRIFRPAFTKAYLARMTGPRSAEEEES